MATVLFQVLDPFLGKHACSTERYIEIIQKNKLHIENFHHKEVALHIVKCKEC